MERRKSQWPADPILRERDERLESLKILVGKMAHDFNNFLVPFLGYVTLVKEDLPSDSPALPYLGTMESSARRAESMLESMLLGVRPQRRFSPKSIDLADIAEQAIKKWNESAGAPERVRICSRFDACPLVGDATQWLTVFEQLLQNARFGLAIGGDLEIVFTKQALSAERAAALNVAEGEAYELTFRDSGIGMAPDVARRAFEPFFTTHPKGQALGLGLTIVHSVVQWHGGQVELETAEDCGTTIRISVPVAGQRTEPTLPGELAPRRAANKMVVKDVLVVDDDPLVTEVVKTYLERMGLQVATAKDGVEALAYFKRHELELGLVISDITMPRMDGIQLYREVRRKNRSVRFLLMTGDVSAAREEALAELGPDRPALLKKPFTYKMFTEFVRGEIGTGS